MMRLLAGFLVRALAVVALLSHAAALAAPTDRIIIKVTESMRPAVLADGAPAPQARQRVSALSATTGREIAWLRAMSGGADVLVLPEALPEEEVAALAAELTLLPGVVYAVPDRRVFPMTEPEDPLYDSQWHLQRQADEPFGINAPAAWSITTGDAVTVAVVDTGIRFTHPDLVAKVLPGHDFIREDPGGVIFTANDGDGRDPVALDTGDWVTSVEASQWACEPANSSWHGTHMAGIIAAATDNGLGVAGVSRGALILPVRALGKCGGYDSDVADGIRWAAGVEDPTLPPNPFPAEVINLSLGRPGACGGIWQDAVTEARNAGALVVGAAGNVSAGGVDLNDTPWTPASCENALIVTATDRAGERAPFANHGSVVDVSAPGVAVLSTENTGPNYPLQDGFGNKSGTSVSAAIVSGVAALVRSRDPRLTPDQVIELLVSPLNVTAFPAESACETQDGCGVGIINAGRAVDAATDPGSRPVEAVVFEPVASAEKGVTVTSGPVTVNTGGGELAIRVAGGTYSVGCAEPYMSEPGSISNGGEICLRHEASAYPEHPAATMLAVGNHRTAFLSMTGAADTTPEEMLQFMPKWGARPGATVTSETITVSGIDAPTPVQVSGDDADRDSRYSLNCASGGFTSEPGYIAPGGTLCVQHVASDERGGEAVTHLTIGGVSTTFSTTTRTGGGGASVWLPVLLLGYLGLKGARRYRKVPQASPVRAP